MLPSQVVAAVGGGRQEGDVAGERAEVADVVGELPSRRTSATTAPVK
jgi:hypothetical protein